MSSSVLYMSMSLDGFIAGPNETLDNPLGDGGLRLHEWDFSGDSTGANRQIYDEFMSTGAIVAGLRCERREPRNQPTAGLWTGWFRGSSLRSSHLNQRLAALAG